MKKNAKKIISLLGLATAFVLLVGIAFPAKADELDDKQKQRENLQQNINDTNKKLQDTQNQIHTLQEEIANLDTRIQHLQDKINETQKIIDELADKIEATQAEIDANRKAYERQKDYLHESIRMLYQFIDKSSLELLFSSEDFSSYQQEKVYHERLEERVFRQLKNLDYAKTRLENSQKELEEQKKEQDKTQKELQEQQKDLENQQDVKNYLLEQTKGEEAAYQEFLKQAQEEQANIDREIARLIYEKYYQNWQQNPDAPPVNVGYFGSPLPWDPPRISVPGGDYMDSLYGWGYHYGVDLRADQGTPIYASASGTAFVHDSGGPGLSFIVIVHDNAYLTVYLHVSAIFVGNGQYVQKGQGIGLSGGALGAHGSGWQTTGPHLHFEIRKPEANPRPISNLSDYSSIPGIPVNPHDYLYILPPY